MQDQFWMQEAFSEALRAEAEGEVPIGVVLVTADGVCLSRAHNRVIQMKDPSAHAEILAMREAASLMGNYRLLGTTLYSTLEPCCMCAGAMVHARIKRLVFAARDPKAGAAVSVYTLLQGYPLNHSVLLDEGVLQEQCAGILKRFFQKKRCKMC